MDAGEGFGGVECGGARRDAVRRERGLRCGGDGFLRQRERQRFERRVDLEREVHALVGVDEDEDFGGGAGCRRLARCVARRGGFQTRPYSIFSVGQSRVVVGIVPSIVAGHSMLCPYGRNSLFIEHDVVRMREARGVALPVGQRRYVVSFPGHCDCHVSGGRVPGGGGHRWYFVGKTPLVAKMLYLLLFANTFAGLIGFPIYDHFAHVDAGRKDSLVNLFLVLQFGLLALLALVFFIYRKDVRYEYRGWKRK